MDKKNILEFFVINSSTLWLFLFIEIIQFENDLKNEIEN